MTNTVSPLQFSVASTCGKYLRNRVEISMHRETMDPLYFGENGQRSKMRRPKVTVLPENFVLHPTIHNNTDKPVVKKSIAHCYQCPSVHLY